MMSDGQNMICFSTKYPNDPNVVEFVGTKEAFTDGFSRGGLRSNTKSMNNSTEQSIAIMIDDVSESRDGS
jgi:hypothetical protein